MCEYLGGGRGGGGANALREGACGGQEYIDIYTDISLWAFFLSPPPRTSSLFFFLPSSLYRTYQSLKKLLAIRPQGFNVFVTPGRRKSRRGREEEGLKIDWVGNSRNKGIGTMKKGGREGGREGGRGSGWDEGRKGGECY